jgi:hypothetical protein
VLTLAAKFVPAADEVYRMQNLKTSTDPECRLFQKFAEQGHYRRPGTTRQGTYCVSPSGVLLGSINSNDPQRIADLSYRTDDDSGSVGVPMRVILTQDQAARDSFLRWDLLRVRSHVQSSALRSTTPTQVFERKLANSGGRGSENVAPGSAERTARGLAR